MSKERWLPVVGYEDTYAVSDHGRVMRTKSGRCTSAGEDPETLAKPKRVQDSLPVCLRHEAMQASSSASCIRVHRRC